MLKVVVGSELGASQRQSRQNGRYPHNICILVIAHGVLSLIFLDPIILFLSLFSGPSNRGR